MTDAERLIWFHLRDRRMAGFKFRRQHPIGPYIADFVCFETQLVIELDGGQHTVAGDYARRRYLCQQGWRVLRFWNDDVFLRQSEVLEEIHRHLLLPSPQSGEGAPERGG
nr:endonuclease domain-containing protein [Lysobacter sp. CJ11]